jgi:hypothetical protein
MRTRTVLLYGLSLGWAVAGTGTGLAGEFPEFPELTPVVSAPEATNPKAASASPASGPAGAKAAAAEAFAKQMGITVAELKRLRQLGFADSEIATQLIENKRTAQQVITEREIVNELASALADANVRAYKKSASEQASERERSMRAALAKVRRDRKVSREELRRVLAGTSLVTPKDMRRLLGFPLFDTDNLRRAGTSVFGEE